MKLVAGILVCRNGAETHTRASTKTAVLQPDTTPATGIPECVECSYNAKGPAIERALVPSLLKEGEKRQIDESVVNMQTWSRKLPLPSARMWFARATAYVLKIPPDKCHNPCFRVNFFLFWESNASLHVEILRIIPGNASCFMHGMFSICTTLYPIT